MRKWFFLLVMVGGSFMQGCLYIESLSGDDEVVQTSQTLDPFDAVVIDTSVKLFLKNDSIFSADIEGQAFVVSRLKIEQKDRTVYIEAGGAGFPKKQAARVVLHASSFKRITSNFPAEIGTLDTLKTNALSMVVNGRGSFTESHMTLKAHSFSLFCYGSNVGTHVLNGRVDLLRVQAEGLTVVEAGNLEAGKVDYVQRSINPGYVFAKEQLEVKMQSSGNVFYLGHPQVNVDYQHPSYQVDLGEVLSWSSIN